MVWIITLAAETDEVSVATGAGVLVAIKAIVGDGVGTCIRVWVGVSTMVKAVAEGVATTGD